MHKVAPSPFSLRHQPLSPMPFVFERYSKTHSFVPLDGIERFLPRAARHAHAIEPTGDRIMET